MDTAFAVAARADRDAGRGVAVLLALAFAALVALPFAVSGYRSFQLTLILANAIAILGLNILTGYNGQISLGHGAFYAAGAYAAAILMGRFGVPYALAVVLAGLLAFGLGFLFGWPALRLDGLYLALATFALGVALPQLLKFKRLEPWTGGVQGLAVAKPDAPFGLRLNADQWLYFFTLGIACLMFMLAKNLLRGRVGLALMAIRDHPVAAAAAGIDTPLYKALAFGISTMYCGVAGALAAIAVQFVAPDSFTTGLSISLLVGVVIGGLASISGALWGAVFIQAVPGLVDQVSKSAPWAVYGVLLIVCAVAMPGGIAGVLGVAWARLRAGGREPTQ